MSAAAARIQVCLALLLCALAPGSAAAHEVVRPTEHPFLYRIEGSPPSFLYGTIHVPDERVLALPRSVRLALKRADVLATELRNDAETQRALLAGLSLPDGQTLADVAGPVLHGRLERYLASRGLPIAPFERLKLLPLGAQLEVLDYLSAKRPPLDHRLIELASQAGKQLDALERPEEQIAALDVLTTAEQIEVIGEELSRLEQQATGAPSPVEKMVRAYVAGDEQELWAESMAYIDPDDPAHARFLDAVFTRRNARLAERIEQRLAAQPPRSYFVALGALHLYGPEAVIARLEKVGRTLVRLDGNATP
jgi:uncharacterized protein YbaP (TraB family)